MTTVELRTSIISELDQMSVGMLENVQQYVRRLRRHASPASKAADKEAVPDIVRNLLSNFRQLSRVAALSLVRQGQLHPDHHHRRWHHQHCRQLAVDGQRVTLLFAQLDV